MSYIIDIIKNVIYIILLRVVFFVNKVKELRKLRNFTQIELAREVGVARQTINLIENDKYNPTLALCISLAKVLQTDLNTLFWESEDLER